MEKITKAQQIKDILKDILKEDFIIEHYIHKNKSCALGHIHRHFNSNDPYGDGEGYGARELSKKFLLKKYSSLKNIATVNNTTTVAIYNEPEIKDRVMHLVEDMIKAGY